MTSSIEHGSADIVLLNPPYENYSAKDKCFYTSYPLGLCYLAAGLRGENLKVGGIDSGIDSPSIYQTIELLKLLDPKIVGISLTSIGLRYSYMLVKGLRDSMPEVIIVLGGPHVACDPSVVGRMGADYGFRGEADDSFPGFCANILAEDDDVREDLVKTDGNVVECTPPASLEDMPFPDRSLFRQDRYEYQSVVASRGCPFQCSYCGMAGTRFRQREIGSVVSEVESILESGYASIHFADDVFTLERDYVVGLCETFIEHDLSFKWSCTTRADLVDPELLKIMGDAGLAHISFGVESGVEHIRYSLGKKISNKEYVDAFKWCREQGIESRAYAMIGHPGETLEDMRETIRFINKLNPDNVIYTPTIVYPGTRLMKYCVGNGLLPADYWDRYMRNDMPPPYFTPRGANLKIVQGILEDGYKSFYMRKEFIIKCIRKARTASEVMRAAGLSLAFVGSQLSRL
ncbi:B12-binding domain-containing radical SAM protein [Candidatus Altiarchaeota archaeon]